MSSVSFDVIARDKASSTLSKVGKNVDKSGSKLKKFGKATTDVGKKMTLGLTGPIVALGAKSFSVFADFDATMRKVGVQTKQSGAGMKSMTDLAMKMGKDTSFSAGEAADAMLELAKGGMTAAQIKGGVLQQTLTLAAAGGLGLGDAATYMTNSLNTFGLGAEDAATVAAALAGAANASTASVESLGMGLAQVGPGARNAGLSLNETVAVLAAFDAAGIKGADAGTSLKTMLTRLVPATDKAKSKMKELGLDFTKADGSFVSIANVAEQLHDKLGPLSEEQRTQALATLFGSDATRAATVLMNEGGKGVNKYTKATEDLTAAQKLAKSNTQGAKGAIEAMQGSIETAEISLGQALSPTVTKVAKKIGALANKFSDLSPKTQETVLKIAALLAVLGPLTIALGTLSTAIAALAANPIMLVVIALAALAIGLTVLYKKSETFRNVVNATFWAVADTVLSVAQVFVGFSKIVVQVLKGITDVAMAWAGDFIHVAALAFGWVPGIGDKLKGAAKSFDKFRGKTDAAFDKVLDKADSTQAYLAKLKLIAKFKGVTTDLDHKIAKARKELKDPNLTKTRKAKLDADIKRLLEKKRQAQQSINALRGKTVGIHLDTGAFYAGLAQVRTAAHGRIASGGQVNLGVPGGVIRKMAGGGKVTGPGTGTSDTAGLFALSNGEFVMKKRAVDKFGPALLHAMNGSGGGGGTARPMHPAAIGGGVQTVRVVVDVKGGDDEMKRLIRKWIRTDNLLQGAR